MSQNQNGIPRGIEVPAMTPVPAVVPTSEHLMSNIRQLFFVIGGILIATGKLTQGNVDIYWTYTEFGLGFVSIIWPYVASYFKRKGKAEEIAKLQTEVISVVDQLRTIADKMLTEKDIRAIVEEGVARKPGTSVEVVIEKFNTKQIADDLPVIQLTGDENAIIQKK